MRIQTASALTIFLLLVPALEAQQRRPSGPPPSVVRPSPGPAPAIRAVAQPPLPSKPVAPIRAVAQRPLPSTPITPMTNPIAPMTNPIGPVVPFGGAGRSLNSPSQLPIRPGVQVGR